MNSDFVNVFSFADSLASTSAETSVPYMGRYAQMAMYSM